MKRWAIGIISLLLKIISHLPNAFIRKIILKYIFRMKIGHRCALYLGIEYKGPWNIVIGSCSSIGSGCILDGRRGLYIGNNVTIAFRVMIWSLQHDYQSSKFEAVGSSVHIKDYAWIGSGAIILPGVIIGKGAVVGAGAVVTKNVDDYAVVVGNPAKHVAYRNKDLDYCSGDWELPFV